MTPMNHETFHGNRSARFSEIRNTDRQSRKHNIYRRTFSLKIRNKNLHLVSTIRKRLKTKLFHTACEEKLTVIRWFELMTYNSVSTL